jgi:hypothetical protein
MGKRKRKLSAAEKAAKKKRRQEYETVFIRGKMKRVKRPPTVEGMSVDDFIRANADPIFLHQEEMWDLLMELENEEDRRTKRRPLITWDDRQHVSFITTIPGDDLVVVYAIALDEPGEIASLILQRTPKYEFLLPQEERGVVVSHELYPGEDREMLRRISVNGSEVDVETTLRTYRLDIAGVHPEEVVSAHDLLKRMHEHGRFRLDGHP